MNAHRRDDLGGLSSSTRGVVLASTQGFDAKMYFSAASLLFQWRKLERQGALLLSDIRAQITELPSYGYRRACALTQLQAAFEPFNEVHPHSSLKMKSTREFRRQQAEQMRQAQAKPAALHCG